MEIFKLNEMWKNSSIVMPSIFNKTQKCNVVIFANGKIMLLNSMYIYFEHLYSNTFSTTIKVAISRESIITAKTIYWKYLN